jgi:hypothetical protein
MTNHHTTVLFASTLLAALLSTACATRQYAYGVDTAGVASSGKAVIAKGSVDMTTDSFPSMSSNKFEKYCEGLVAALNDEKHCAKAFKNAIGVLDSILAGDYARDRAKDGSLITSAEALSRATHKK